MTKAMTEPYSIRTLGLQYGIEPAEAERLLARFACSKVEMDRLLTARGRTAKHRRREMSTPVSQAAFGIG
ncbi:hypothetical protein [Rhizobium sp. OAE497]|uniref:hypothetical protein n=1 Tax=Rhizobium sp. OAE497 TaxID=2663796 RepID=UPI0018F78D31